MECCRVLRALRTRHRCQKRVLVLRAELSSPSVELFDGFYFTGLHSSQPHPQGGVPHRYAIRHTRAIVLRHLGRLRLESPMRVWCLPLAHL